MRRSATLAASWCVWCALAFASLCISAPAARADQVALKNGDRLTGTIVKSDGKTLLRRAKLEAQQSRFVRRALHRLPQRKRPRPISFPVRRHRRHQAKGLAKLASHRKRPLPKQSPPRPKVQRRTPLHRPTPNLRQRRLLATNFLGSCNPERTKT